MTSGLDSNEFSVERLCSCEDKKIPEELVSIEGIPLPPPIEVKWPGEGNGVYILIPEPRPAAGKMNRINVNL